MSMLPQERSTLHIHTQRRVKGQREPKEKVVNFCSILIIECKQVICFLDQFCKHFVNYPPVSLLNVLSELQWRGSMAVQPSHLRVSAVSRMDNRPPVQIANGSLRTLRIYKETAL